MTASIVGLGTARPPWRLSQEDAAAFALARCGADARGRRALLALYRRAAVRSRAISAPRSSDGEFYPPMIEPGDRGPTTSERMRVFERVAPALAAAAGRRALRDAGVDVAAITHVVAASCTGFGAPGLEIMLARRLRMAPSVRRVHVGFMGCHAALNALEVASALATAQGGAVVLVCCAELCSLHFQYGFDAEQAVANALFADGAAAAVVTAAPGARTATSFALRAFASRIVEGAAGAMTWRVLDHGFAMTLSPRVPGLVARALRPWIDDWLAESGLRVGDVASWAIHAGGPRIVGAVARGLGLPAAAVAPSRAVLRACGNMSSATVLFILDRLRRAGAPRPCVALAFGPGLAIEAVLLGG